MEGQNASPHYKIILEEWLALYSIFKKLFPAWWLRPQSCHVDLNLCWGNCSQNSSAWSSAGGGLLLIHPSGEISLSALDSYRKVEQRRGRIPTTSECSSCFTRSTITISCDRPLRRVHKVGWGSFVLISPLSHPVKKQSLTGFKEPNVLPMWKQWQRCSAIS